MGKIISIVTAEDDLLKKTEGVITNIIFEKYFGEYGYCGIFSDNKYRCPYETVDDYKDHIERIFEVYGENPKYISATDMMDDLMDNDILNKEKLMLFIEYLMDVVNKNENFYIVLLRTYKSKFSNTLNFISNEIYDMSEDDNKYTLSVLKHLEKPVGEVVYEVDK